MATEPSTPDPEVLRDPVVCTTPACRGPATLWRIGRLTLKVCQGCAGHWGTSVESEEMYPAAGWPLASPAAPEGAPRPCTAAERDAQNEQIHRDGELYSAMLVNWPAPDTTKSARGGEQ